MSSTTLRPGAVAIPAVAAAALYANPLWTRNREHRDLAADPSRAKPQDEARTSSAEPRSPLEAN